MTEQIEPKDITAAEAQQLLASEAPPALLDVREPAELQAYGRIPGSLHIPMRDVPARAGELDASCPLIVYCAGGVRSYDVGAYLLEQGFTEVMNLEGGLATWDGNVERV